MEKLTTITSTLCAQRVDYDQLHLLDKQLFSFKCFSDVCNRTWKFGIMTKSNSAVNEIKKMVYDSLAAISCAVLLLM